MKEQQLTSVITDAIRGLELPVITDFPVAGTKSNIRADIYIPIVPPVVIEVKSYVAGVTQLAAYREVLGPATRLILCRISDDGASGIEYRNGIIEVRVEAEEKRITESVIKVIQDILAIGAESRNTFYSSLSTKQAVQGVVAASGVALGASILSRLFPVGGGIAAAVGVPAMGHIGAIVGTAAMITGFLGKKKLTSKEPKEDVDKIGGNSTTEKSFEVGYDRNGYDRKGYDHKDMKENGAHSTTGTLYDTEGFIMAGFEKRENADKIGGNSRTSTPQFPDSEIKCTASLAQLFSILPGIEVKPIECEIERLKKEYESEHWQAATLQCGRIAEAIVYTLARSWDIPLTTNATKEIQKIQTKMQDIEHILIGFSYEENTSAKDATIKKYRKAKSELNEFLEEILLNLTMENLKIDQYEGDKNSIHYLIKGLMKKFKPRHPQIYTKEKVLADSYVKITKYRNLAAHAPINDISKELSRDDFEKTTDALTEFVMALCWIFQVMSLAECKD